MRRAGGGSIIMSSVAGLCGSAGSAGYCANEGGVRLFAKAVAMECAAAGDGIRVNTVHPGIIDTPIWTKSPTSSGSNALIDPNEVAKPVYRSAGLGKHRICERCALSRLRRLQLHDGSGAGDRRRHDGGAELDGWREGSPSVGSKCDFGGKFHMNISMEDSAKLALLARATPPQPPGCEKTDALLRSWRFQPPQSGGSRCG